MCARQVQVQVVRSTCFLPRPTTTTSKFSLQAMLDCSCVHASYTHTIIRQANLVHALGIVLFVL